MKRLYLTPEEKASLEAAHHSCENKKEGDRIKAILLRSEGWTVPQTTKLTYGWIRTGKTKHVGTTASRTRLNIVGAIQLGHVAKAITAQYETINAESIINFMDKIRDQHGSKTVHLIIDKAGYHRSLLVAEHALSLNIKLHFLPPYNPNLNQIERLWKVMNEKVRNNRCFKGAKDFKEAINSFFDDILQRIGNALNGRINDNFQLLKT